MESDENNQRNLNDVEIEILGASNDKDSQSHAEEGRQEVEQSNQVKEKTIEGYYESLSSKSFKETLKFHKENILHLPSREENIHPLTLEERTRIDTIIAVALFILR